MTIYLYTGTPGSGKSMHTAKLIMETLRYKKCPVVCNFPVNSGVKGYQRFTYCDNAQLTPKYLFDYAATFWAGESIKEDTILLVVDEAQLLFNSREWGQSNRMAWIEFLSQHRHLGYKVIFIAQFDRMIDRQIRALVEYECIHRRMGNFGFKGKLISLFCGGELFVVVKMFYGLKERIGLEYTRKHKKYFRLYDSYATFSRTAVVPEGAGCSGVPAPMVDGCPNGELAPARTLEMPPLSPPVIERLKSILFRDLFPRKKKGDHAKS